MRAAGNTCPGGRRHEDFVAQYQPAKGSGPASVPPDTHLLVSICNMYYILLKAIRSFADRDTEAVWLDRRVRRFEGVQAKRRLNVPNAAATLDDLRNNPGARLHRFRGDRAGQWSVAVNAQYRIVFDWKDGPVSVEIVDNHR